MTNARAHAGLLLRTLWTPAYLATPPAAWFNDDSAVTDVSGACSQWNDISGNGYHHSQGSGALRPAITANDQAGRRVLTFDGSNDILFASSGGALAAFQNKAAGFVMGVYRKVSDTGNRYIFSQFINSGTNVRILLAAGDATGDRMYAGGRRLDADTFGQTTGVTARAAQWVMALAVFDYVARTIALYANGSSEATASTLWGASGNSENLASLQSNIGASSSGFYNGKIGEVLFGGSKPSAGEIDKLFGYAAYRWGLQSALPGGHAYKTDPPLL